MNDSFILIFLESTAETPKIKRMFVMFEPTTFPTTISELFCMTAITEDINSGNDVPTATIVTPTTNGDIPRDKPIFSAASVNLSDDFANIVKEAIKTNNQIIMFIIVSP